MKNKAKKVLAVLILIIIVFGWLWMFKGIGSLEPLKDKMQLGLDIKGGVYVVMEAQDTDQYSSEELRELMEQTQAVITNRVDEMGLANPNVTIEGKDRIRVELPGAEDADEAIEQIGRTAQLKFTLANQQFIMDGSNVKDATSGTNQDEGGYVVNLEFDSEGGEAFEEATTESSSGKITSTITDDSGNQVDDTAIVIWLDDEIISAPTTSQTISGGSCEISGSFSKEEAANLAALIRGGSLPLELEEVTSSVQSAQIGLNALTMSIYAGIIGLICIFIIMFVGYRIMGLAANIALSLYIVIVLAVMALFGSVLNLPGIAGIILAIGMAVDSNVIIFTRIKEEIVGGKSVRVAVQSGLKRALGTVIDSQVTTLIAAVILYQIGTSSVKGFAFTLMLGIIVSIFTAVVVTQLYLGIFASSERFSHPKYFGIKSDGTAAFRIKRQFHFMRHSKKYFAVAGAILVIGLGFFAVRGFNTGIDFTGGTMFQIDMGKYVSESSIKDTLKDEKLDPEIVYSGDDNEVAIIKTAEALNNEERQEVLGVLQDEYGFEDDDVEAMEHFGPSAGKDLRNNAIKAVILAALGMLVYIRLRFRKWTFGAAAILGVLHDALFLMTFYLVFRVTVNNPFIAAILTVVGYSINDTIVIFDRIRENNRQMRGSAEDIIDASINQTLSRSVMTSVTTLIVMVPLIILGGSAIREFVLPLMVGVGAGTLSSIFLCSPMYYSFTQFRKSRYKGAEKKTGKAKRKTDEVHDAEDIRLSGDEGSGSNAGKAEGVYIPTADTTQSKKDIYKGKKKQSRKSRKGGGKK